LLRIELADLKLEEFPLGLLGFDDTELASILNSRSVGATDPDDVPPVPANPIARPGDLWQLGRHVLLCGDATERADVDMLLAGEQPHLMIVDPPYGVEYDPDWRNRADRKSGRPIGARAVGRPVNDHRSDWSAAWNLFPGDVVYQWHAGLHARDTQHALEEAGFEIRAQIIWAKQQFVIGRGHYHVQHEPCWYAVRKGASGHWNGDRSQSTIWNIDKPLKSETGHSTQKPVECMLRPIENNSKAGDAIFDPFLGSGTTAIAAEMTGRRCYAIEISPAYCDVAILRWQDFTGERAMLEGRTFAEVRGARCDPDCDRAEGVEITREALPPGDGGMADQRTLR
jgi:DNA modification methylase